MPKAVTLPLVAKGGAMSDFATEGPESTIPGLVNPETVSVIRQSGNRADYSVVEDVGGNKFHVALTVEETCKRLGFDVEK